MLEGAVDLDSVGVRGDGVSAVGAADVLVGARLVFGLGLVAGDSVDAVQEVQVLLQRLRDRRFKGAAIRQREPIRVQPEAPGKAWDRRDRAVGVALVAHDRVADAPQMAADLMLAAGGGADAQVGQQTVGPHATKVGRALQAAFAPGVHERPRDGKAGLGAAVDQRAVLLADRAVGKPLRHGLADGRVGGAQQDAGGRSVQPVDGVKAARQIPLFTAPVDQRWDAAVGGTVDHKPGGLVDNPEIAVLRQHPRQVTHGSTPAMGVISNTPP